MNKKSGSFFKPLDFQKTTVYQRWEPEYYKFLDEKKIQVTREEFVKLEGQKEVRYYEKQYSYKEFAKLQQSIIKNLERDLTISNMENVSLLSEITKLNELNQSQMMMEVVNMISQLQGGE